MKCKLQSYLALLNVDMPMYRFAVQTRSVQPNINNLRHRTGLALATANVDTEISDNQMLSLLSSEETHVERTHPVEYDSITLNNAARWLSPLDMALEATN